jgi:hypothetical protein
VHNFKVFAKMFRKAFNFKIRNWIMWIQKAKGNPIKEIVSLKKTKVTLNILTIRYFNLDQYTISELKTKLKPIWRQTSFYRIATWPALLHRNFFAWSCLPNVGKSHSFITSHLTRKDHLEYPIPQTNQLVEN